MGVSTTLGALLVRGADVYAPAPLGRRDILVVGHHVVRMDRRIAPSEIPLPGLTTLSARGYLAFNIESRGINGYVPDEDLQIGLLFHRPGTDLQIRPALDFYNGYSPMGDLIFEKEHYASLGVYFDF